MGRGTLRGTGGAESGKEGGGERAGIGKREYGK